MEKEYSKFIAGDYVNTLDSNGWAPIVDWIFQTLLVFANGKDIKIAYIKEKWGELRIYYRGADSNDFRWVFNKAEELSRNTCYFCKKNGEVKNLDGYFLAVCDEHSTKFPESE